MSLTEAFRWRCVCVSKVFVGAGIWTPVLMILQQVLFNRWAIELASQVLFCKAILGFRELAHQCFMPFIWFHNYSPPLSTSQHQYPFSLQTPPHLWLIELNQGPLYHHGFRTIIRAWWCHHWVYNSRQWLFLSHLTVKKKWNLHANGYKWEKLCLIR